LIIEVRELSKVFRLPHARGRTLFQNVRSVLNGGYEYDELFALQNISFDVKKGEFLGIIGRNGSGKSTLLKVLARIYLPTSGNFTIYDTLYPLLELGIGFQPDFTVRDNLFIYGSFIGISRKEMNSRMDQILQFAEIQKFSDAKLDTLSSGMKVRLAFSIAIEARASIYLVDEVLAVGDRWFQEKCKQEFRKLKAEKKTVLFVSHDQESVQEFCDRVIVMSEGKIVNQGPPKEMIEYYNHLPGSLS
jgi:ABC-type polysaccharide/polyol phosphate transport system ATPase subunit